MAAKQFTLAEVAEHNTREDLYLVIRDEVYAVSKFVAEVSIDNLFHDESFWKFDLNFVTFWFLFASIQVKLRHCRGWSTVWRHGDLRDACNYGCRVIRLLISLQFNRRGNISHAMTIHWHFRFDRPTGGEEILIEYAGKDATSEFDDVGHSQDAKDLLKQFHVGSLVESDRASNKVAKKKEEAKR